MKEAEIPGLYFEALMASRSAPLPASWRSASGRLAGRLRGAPLRNGQRCGVDLMTSKGQDSVFLEISLISFRAVSGRITRPHREDKTFAAHLSIKIYSQKILISFRALCECSKNQRLALARAASSVYSSDGFKKAVDFSTWRSAAKKVRLQMFAFV